MQQAQIDPENFYEFDLATGAVHTREGDRVVLISDTAVGSLISNAVSAGDLTTVRQLGELFAEQAKQQINGDHNELSLEAVVGYLSGVTALFGWGRVGIETWGDTLVLLAKGLPSVDEGELGTAALLGGLFSSLAGRQVACVPAGESRFIVVDHKIAETVWGWVQDGLSVQDIAARLEAE